ncbi:MAG: flippase [Microgenomates group bacterium]
MKKTIALNTLAQIIGKIISGGTTFFVSILLARALGVDGYGDFTKITTYVAFFYLFCDFGLNAAYLQLKEKQTDKQLKNALFTTRFVLSLLLMFITLAITTFLPGSSEQGYSTMVKMGIILFTPTVLFQAIITTTNAFFQERLRYDFATYATIAGSLVTLVCILALTKILLPNAMVFGSLLAFLLGSLFTTIIALFFVKKFAGLPSLTVDVKTIKKLLLTALPLGITLLFNVVYFRIDSVVLTITRSTMEVGTYGLAYKFFEMALVIPTFFMNAALPSLMRAKKEADEKKLRSQIRNASIALFLLSLFVAVAGWIVSPLITMIKPEFVSSILPFKVLLVGLPIFYLSSLTMWVLVVEKRQKQMLIIYALSMVFNIIANILFIPTYGYMAAAYITLISELFILLTSFFSIKRA